MSTNVDDFLAHYGVKGMKWGVRKDLEVIFTKSLKNGGTLVATKDPTPPIAKALSKLSSKYRESLESQHHFTLRNSEGKSVGDASFRQDSPDSLNLMWIGVKNKERGKGYASAAVGGVVKYAKDKGFNKLTLEVPGDAPDARHIYEKLGFKDTGVKLGGDDDFWGGLTVMELNIAKSVKHSESLLDFDDLTNYVIESIDNSDLGKTASTDADDFLEHYGVKGMKWGVRKDASDGPSNRQIRTTAKYLSKGFSQEVAEKKARGRIAAENVLLVSGATVLAAGAGYLAFNEASRHFGGVNLPMGTPVHHVNVHGPKLNIQDKPMFVSFDKRDQKFYDSVFANFAKNRANAENIYKSTLETTKDIRAPSNFQAKRLYKEFQKLHPDVKSPYSTFNYTFNGEGQGSPRVKKAFSEFMQGKGYNAMIDNFDSVKSTRLRTNKPTILFDPTRAVKKVDDILLNNDKVATSALGYELRGLAKNVAVNPKSMALTIMVGLGAFGSSKNSERARMTRVNDYKTKHPGTELSDAQIYNLVGYSGR